MFSSSEVLWMRAFQLIRRRQPGGSFIWGALRKGPGRGTSEQLPQSTSRSMVPRHGLREQGDVDRSLCKGHSASGAWLPVCLGPCQPVFCSDSEEESKQGDFQMVFACFLLCFPLEGEAATVGPLNLGPEELGMRSWRGEGLCEMRSLKPL